MSTKKSTKLTAEQVADRWEVPRRTVYDCMNNRGLPHIPFNERVIRFRLEDVIAYESKLRTVSGGSRRNVLA